MNTTTRNLLSLLLLFILVCCEDDSQIPEEDNTYTGTGSVTQGVAATVTNNLLSCQGGRVAGIGTINSTDGTSWTVPAKTNYTDASFPFASDLHNSCSGVHYNSADEALAKLDGSDIITVDAGGQVITAYVFVDNYFEMYINGKPVGKDNVPFTQFNSNIVRFRVNTPFTIAMKLVDWEENLGLGSEANGGKAYHPGDGGLVAVFKNASGEIIAVTDNTWKAQVFYISPIKALSCLSESGTSRVSASCNTDDSNDGSNYYGIHWEVPSTWMNASFDDASWPSATTYTNDSIGVNGKQAYTNFTQIFDAAQKDAKFIWSSNLVLDNEVIVRKTVN